MSQPPALRIPVRTVIAFILVLLFAFFVRSYLQLELRALGYVADHARDLSYLMVSPVLVLMLLPIFRNHKNFMRQLLRRSQLTVRLILSAVALGVLMRLIWWSQVIARISFGLARDHDPDAIVGPAFSFACPPPQVIGLGFLVMALLVPGIEEVLHRGFLQSAFVHKGRTAAVLLSATIFTLFHPPTSYAFVFVLGIVFGLQFWNTRTLWATIVTHATYNGLIQLDWRCLRGAWNPPEEELPFLIPGSVALGVLLTASACAIWLLTRKSAGATSTPRHP